MRWMPSPRRPIPHRLIGVSSSVLVDTLVAFGSTIPSWKLCLHARVFHQDSIRETLEIGPNLHRQGRADMQGAKDVPLVSPRGDQIKGSRRGSFEREKILSPRVRHREYKP
jgi:hypothetical protein